MSLVMFLNFLCHILQEFLYRGIKLIIDLVLLIWMPIGVFFNSMATPDKEFFSILITGASSGIGKAVAKHYAKKGVHLFLTARREDKLEEVKKICEDQGANVTIFKADVTDKERMIEVVSKANEEKPLDLVFANAGTSGKNQNQVVNVNCNGIVNTVGPAYNAMKKRGGQICINSSVTAAFGGWPGDWTYAATKSFALHFGRGLRPRAAKYNIGVSVVCPGFVKTDMVAGILEKDIVLNLVSIDAQSAANYIDYACKRNLNSYVFPRFYNLYVDYWQTNWNLDNFRC